MTNINQPLVSVIVITYNSAKTVLETLESAKSQTYENIELIVSDDCSIDNTVGICQQWIQENQKRFVRTELIVVEKNTGVAPNCNRGVRASQAEWMKLIAGDDVLLNECINDGVEFIKSHLDTQIFASNVKKFYNDHKLDSFQTTQLEYAPFFNPSVSCKNQLEMILQHNAIIAPSVFLSKRVFELNNGFDESIPFIEDYPFWIKTLQNGIKIDFLPAITVGYRLSENSVSSFNINSIFNNFYKQHYVFQKQYTFKYMTYRQRFNHMYIYYVKCIFVFFDLNKLKFSKVYSFFLRLNIFNWQINTFRKFLGFTTDNNS